MSEKRGLRIENNQPVIPLCIDWPNYTESKLQNPQLNTFLGNEIRV